MSVFDIKEEAFEVIIDGKKYVGHLAYQELSPRPLVLIFPNVAGLKGFDQQKAYEMAELGYVGLAVDLYGDHTIPFKDREDALGSALPQIFGFMNELLCDKVELHKRMKAFLDAGLAHPAVDTSHGWAATGYCFDSEGNIVSYDCQYDYGNYAVWPSSEYEFTLYYRFVPVIPVE